MHPAPHFQPSYGYTPDQAAAVSSTDKGSKLAVTTTGLLVGAGIVAAAIYLMASGPKVLTGLQT